MSATIENPVQFSSGETFRFSVGIIGTEEIGVKDFVLGFFREMVGILGDGGRRRRIGVGYEEEWWG